MRALVVWGCWSGFLLVVAVLAWRAHRRNRRKYLAEHAAWALGNSAWSEPHPYDEPWA